MRTVAYHEIPDSYRNQTLARAEEIYGRPEVDPEALEYWAEQEEAEAREEWQNERAVEMERFVPENDVHEPHVMHITAAGGHTYHVSPACE
jgi:hypothetical protein